MKPGARRSRTCLRPRCRTSKRATPCALSGSSPTRRPGTRSGAGESKAETFHARRVKSQGADRSTSVISSGICPEKKKKIGLVVYRSNHFCDSFGNLPQQYGRGLVFGKPFLYHGGFRVNHSPLDLIRHGNLLRGQNLGFGFDFLGGSRHPHGISLARLWVDHLPGLLNIMIQLKSGCLSNLFKVVSLSILFNHRS